MDITDRYIDIGAALRLNTRVPELEMEQIRVKN